MTVYLVGAGPGDPGLITVRGAELLSRAEVVIHDRLTAAPLLDLVPDGAEIINVGKDPAGDSVPQDHINGLLVSHGRAGHTVVRLKGGDPFVFARGAEEAAALTEAGVAHEVVPGITSAFAAPAYAGIPVTLRYSSTNVTVVTGHEDPRKGRTDVNWEALARAGGTIVILMGVGRWPAISERLLAGGLAPDTPVAAVRWGTTARQETVRATLSTLVEHALAAPSVIVVGGVAAERLDWFEDRPLFGRTVVVTRPRSDAGALAARLEDVGAEVRAVPTIEIVDPSDGGDALRGAVERLHEFEWLAVTSANAARRVAALLRDARDLGSTKVAAIGPGTADALASAGIVADLVPTRAVAESLLEDFPPPTGAARVLLPRAEVARDVLPDGLRSAGWDVEVVTAYRTVAVPADPAATEVLRDADAICFTSASTVTNFVDAHGVPACPAVVAAIGPITARAAADAGIEVDVVAEPHTLDGLVDALVGVLA